MGEKLRKNGVLEHGAYDTARKGKGCLSGRAGALLAGFAVLVLLSGGCGASADKTAADRAAETNLAGWSYEMGGAGYWEEGAEAPGSAADREEAVEEPDRAADASGQDIREGRKLIETVRLELETREFQQMMSGLEAQIQELGGYVESLETYNGSSYSESRGSRRASLTVRIPSDRLEDFLQTVAECGNIVRRSDSVEDVTLTYVDMESRRDVLRTEQSRLLEFLEKAQTIEEIITIEERLSEVRYELESMESRLRAMDNLIDYSTVYIEASEVSELTPAEEPSVWERISEGFAGSLESIGHGVLELGIWFLVHLPYLAIWGLLVTAVVLLIRRHRRKKNRKLEEQLRRTAAPADAGFGNGGNEEK